MGAGSAASSGRQGIGPVVPARPSVVDRTDIARESHSSIQSPREQTGSGYQDLI